MHTVSVFGAAGYAGLELIKLLAGHPGVRLVCAASDTRAGMPIDELTGTQTGMAFVSTQAAMATEAEVALLATPPGPAVELAQPLVARGTRVIDLSNAHRADAKAVYGLASLFGGEVGGAALVANPGCYATAVITALAPAVRYQLIEPMIAVAAGSGVTGAGRTADEAMSLGEMYGEVRAYKVLRHQHVPEIELALARVAASAQPAPSTPGEGAPGTLGSPGMAGTLGSPNRAGTLGSPGMVGTLGSPNRAGTPGSPGMAGPIDRPRIALTTHLLPVARGIFATVTARLRVAISGEALADRYREVYAGDRTVTIAASAEQVSLRRVVGTNTCAIGVATEGVAGGFVVITAALDNLLKGAAGQAIENLNLMLGLERTAGLTHLARHG